MNEHTIIVGASSPLASATAKGFLERGDKVTLVSRKGIAVPDLGPGSDAQPAYSFDLSDLARIPDLLRRIVQDHGAVTRICFFQRYRDGAHDQWEGEYAIGLRATSKLIEEFKKLPPDSRDRSVVIVSSPADTGVVLEQSASYHAVKAGLSQLVRYYGVALGPAGIRVNGVRPAIVLKPRAERFYAENPDLVTLFNRVTPLGRMGLPVDIANAVLFLSSASASYITGQILSVDGGLSLHEAGSLARLASSVFNSDLEDPRWKSAAE